MDNRPHIFSTRPVSPILQDEARQKGIRLSAHSFIEVKPILSEAVSTAISKYLKEKITAIFTSMNAVEAVLTQANEKPDWNVGCIGHTTCELAVRLVGREKIIATANYADELAENILWASDGPYVFFSGNLRREVLPSIFKEHGQELDELVVYTTEMRHYQLNETIDAIAFYSPSAVESFFSTNTLEKDVIVFAIGNTTAESIKNFVPNQVIISSEPKKDTLVKEMIQYFYQKENA